GGEVAPVGLDVGPRRLGEGVGPPPPLLLAFGLAVGPLAQVDVRLVLVASVTARHGRPPRARAWAGSRRGPRPCPPARQPPGASTWPGTSQRSLRGRTRTPRGRGR